MFNRNLILGALFSCAIAVTGLKTAIDYANANVGYYAASQVGHGPGGQAFYSGILGGMGGYGGAVLGAKIGAIGGPVGMVIGIGIGAW